MQGNRGNLIPYRGQWLKLQFHTIVTVFASLSEIGGHNTEILLNSLGVLANLRHKRPFCLTGGEMPVPRIPTRQIKEILCLKYEANLSHN